MNKKNYGDVDVDVYSGKYEGVCVCVCARVPHIYTPCSLLHTVAASTACACMHQTILYYNMYRLA